MDTEKGAGASGPDTAGPDTAGPDIAGPDTAGAAPSPALVPAFGDLAARIGLGRPAGQVFGLIALAPTPLCADDLVAHLGLSRSNISTALTELRNWNLLDTVRRHGDRREYFAAPADPWVIVQRTAYERAKRETAPALAAVQAAVRVASQPEPVGEGAARSMPETAVRLRALAGVLAQIWSWQERLASLEPGAFAAMIAQGVAGSTGDALLGDRKAPDSPKSGGKKKKSKGRKG